MAAVDPDQYETLHNRFISAREKAALADHHAKRIPQLEEELASEEGKHAELVETLAAEERDVEKLEKFSFQKLKAKLGEGLDATREREMLEAQAAADAVVESSEHMAGLRSEIKRLTTELDDLDGATEAVDAARFELETFVRRSFPDAADELGALDENIAALKAEIIEVEEAIAAGDFAVLEMNELMKTLKDAKNMSTVDLFGDGMIGLLFSMSKRDRIKVSSQKSREAALALEIFGREVRDTSLSLEDLGMDDLIGNELLDVWFDNFFTDMMMHSKIEEALKRSADVLASVTDAVQELRTLNEESLVSIEASEKQRHEVLARRQ